MKRTITILAVLLVVGGTAGGAWWYVNENPEWWFWLQDEFERTVDELGLLPEEGPEGLLASGFIEAEEASVTAELGGRIVGLHADEGDDVVAGQVVAALDASLLLAQVEQARADVAAAEASLALVQAGIRQETLDHAEAQLDQARVAADLARVAWEDSQDMLESPQDLELAVTAARAELGVLRVQERQAQALAKSAQAGRDFADEAVRLLEEFEARDEWVAVGSYPLDNLPVNIPLPPGLRDGEYRIGKYKIVLENGIVTLLVRVQFEVAPQMLDEARYEQAVATYQSWTAWTGLAQAQAAKAGTEVYLDKLIAQRSNPLTLRAQANAAKSEYEIASAAVALAEAQVKGLELGATVEQIAAAEAQVEMARAALDALEVQMDKLMLTAPISGLVLERPVHMGEVAMPGAPVMTLANLDRLTLTVYVPEDRLGKVRLGQEVSVTVDAYPGRTFPGTVVFIASRAEFTPKNVQTREDRVNMVFAVKVRLPNPDHALKPGMPADAVFAEIGNPALEQGD
jgi:multidrug efflux pump subunit AcrA (membrane-fusion protein)